MTLALADDYIVTVCVDGVTGPVVVRRFTSRRYSVPYSANIGETELLKHVHQDRTPEEADNLWMQIAVTAIAAVRTHLGESHAATYQIARHDR